MAAARNAHRLREDTQLLPWLYTIARNKHRNALRLSAFDRRREAEIASEPPSPAAAPDSAAEARVRVARVSAALPRLSVAHREILLLLLGEGLEAEQVAEVLGLRVDAVRKRLSRARAELAALVNLPKENVL